MKAPILHPDERCELRRPNPARDCFGYPDPPYLTWVNCREYAQIYLARSGRSTQRMCYAFNPIHYEQDISDIPMNIARWFWYIEGHMSWEDRTRVHTCQHDNCVVIHYSGGWFQNEMSACLATLMTRVAPHCYHGADMDEVFGKYPRTQSTQSAIYRFLQGNQHYTGWCRATTGNGWAAAFDGRSWDEITTLLIPASQVTDLAYQIWEESGRPEGLSHEMWLAACSRLRQYQRRGEELPIYFGLDEGIVHSQEMAEPTTTSWYAA